MAIDFVWLSYIAGGVYTKALGALRRPLAEFTAGHWVSTALVYGLIAIGITVFVLPRATSMSTAALYGAIFGLVLYGVYECTSYALLANWPGSLIAVDIIWGAVLCGVLGAVGYWVAGY